MIWPYLDRCTTGLCGVCGGVNASTALCRVMGRVSCIGATCDDDITGVEGPDHGTFGFAAGAAVLPFALAGAEGVSSLNLRCILLRCFHHHWSCVLCMTSVFQQF